MYDKIKTLISRNDFATAEKLLEKHRADLSEQQKKELWDLIAEQQRKRQRDALKRDRRLKRCGRWRVVWAIEKGLFICWLILSYILYPYGKMKYFTLLSSWDGPPFQHRLSMELLFLLELILMALFFCLKSFVSHWQKVDHQEMKCQLEKSDIDEIQLLETLTRSYGKKEKGWLIALLCTVAGIAIHLAAMAIWF